MRLRKILLSTVLVGWMVVGVLVFSALGEKEGVVSLSVRERVDALPDQVERFYQKHEKELEGDGMAMREALEQLLAVLKEEAIFLQMAQEEEAKVEEVRQEVERDLKAIARTVFYDRHAEGWGGRMDQVDGAQAGIDYLQSRIAYYVTRLFENEEAFDLQVWHEKWKAVEPH